jgi:stage V sporulation protein B
LPTPEETVARQSLSSSAILTFTNIVANAVLAVGSLLVARLLAPQNYGLYSLALSLPFFIQLLIGVGVTNAITRFSAYHLSRGEIQTAKRMTRNGIAFVLTSSLVFTLVTIFLAQYLASIFLHRPDITVYVQIAALSIISQTAFSCISVSFMGWGAPSQVALWTILQAFLKLVFSVGLILAGFGVLGAIYGYFLSLLIVGILGISSLYLLKFRDHSPESGDLSQSTSWNLGKTIDDLRQMIRYGLPAYIGNILLAFSQQPVLVVILSAIASNTVIGYYSAANVVSAGVAVVFGSVTTALFPAFSRLDGMKSDTGIAFKYAVKYVSFIVMPALIFLIASSNLVIGIFYGSAYSPAVYYLELLTISFLPLAFGQAVIPSYFMGIGKTRLMMLLNIAETIATLVPAFVLIVWLKLGISGLLYSIIISNIVPTVLGLYFAKRYLRANADYFNLLKTLGVSLVCYLAIYLVSTFLFSGAPQVLEFISELIIFLALYLTLAPLSGMIKNEDVNRLRSSSSGLTMLNKILNPLLNYENKIIEWLAHGSN